MKKIFIIIFILGFLLFYYYKKKLKAEYIHFLSKEESFKFISLDNDNYIKNMSKYDLYARKVLNSQEYISKIQALDFTENQKNNLTKCINIIKSKSEFAFLFTNYSLIKFALIDIFYEEGFPHTRADIIFLSPSVCNVYSNTLVKIIIHELVHIYQRYNYNMIIPYLIKNNFSISRKRITEPLIRSNPDLDEYIYKHNNNEILYLYDINKINGINDIIKINNCEHPFEFMAEEISELYMY